MSEAQQEYAALVRGLTAEIERREAMGEGAQVAAARVTEGAPTLAAPAGPGAGPADRTSPASTATAAAGAPDLPSLRELVAGCTACALCETRTQTVFADGPDPGTGRGTGQTRVLFIGEAPGQHEDEQGVPFVGRAGQLLTDIIEKGMGLTRAEVTIANVLKCRPPGNRDPSPAEKALCTPFLDRQVELVDPEVLIPLGLHATQHVLDSTESMGRLRGRVHRPAAGRRFAGRKVVPTYHPAFLLRTPSMKKECWRDIQVAMRELGLPGSSGGSS